MSKTSKEISFRQAIVPIAVFFGLIIYGLFIHKLIFTSSSGDMSMLENMLPIEILVLIAISFSCSYLFYLGYDWNIIQKHIIKKMSESIPVLLILLSIGVLIGSWIVSGTIPMLIYYGISIIDPNWIYIFSFIICIIFSMLTGTSWGSAGTIGVVMMGIASVYDANLAINAGAVVGGAFFGDKMSPLSDTTNIASLATNVPLYDHIKSMVYTTGPAAILSAIVYIFLSPGMSSDAISDTARPESIVQTLDGLEQMFNFNILLLLPILIVVYGSIKRKSIMLTLLMASWVAVLLGMVFQEFSLIQILNSLKDGFNTSMSSVALSEETQSVLSILNRGGLYSLKDGVIITILIFCFIGTLDVIQAIQISLKQLMQKLKTRATTIASALLATFFTNITASNQYATSFIIGESFNEKFDKLKINRKVLSRSIEDAGTMMENLFPWTPSGVFMSVALGVQVMDYVQWQFLSLFNIVIAFFFAFTGIACFYQKGEE